MIHDPPHTASAVPVAAMEAVMAERFRQMRDFGHDAAADDALPPAALARAAHVRLLDTADLVSGRASAAELQRARRKCIQAASLCLAQIDRIDRALARADVDSPL